MGVSHLVPSDIRQTARRESPLVAASQGKDITGHTGLISVSCPDLLVSPQPSDTVLPSAEGQSQGGAMDETRSLQTGPVSEGVSTEGSPGALRTSRALMRVYEYMWRASSMVHGLAV